MEEFAANRVKLARLSEEIRNLISNYAMIRSVAPRYTLLLISRLVVLLKILGIRLARRESVLVKAGCRTLKFHALWNESAFPRLFLRFQHSYRIVVPSLGEEGIIGVSE